MRDVILSCYKHMSSRLAPQFRVEYAKGLRAFVDVYPELDQCARVAQRLSRLCGTDIGHAEAMEIVRKFDLLYRERRARISMDRSWLFPLGSVPMLSLDNLEHWASDNQIAAGKVLKNILSDNGVHVPDFIAICLNPTAGIAGPGNLRIFDPRPGTVMAVHSAIHDSYGYAKLYHGMGVGYNYMQSWLDIFPTTSPRSGQISGIWYCYWHRPRMDVGRDRDD